MAEEEYKKAVERLDEFEKGDDGVLLKKLRRKRKELDEEDKEEKKRLEKKEERLEVEKKRWGDQVEYLQKALVEFSEGKGNEQIV